jgi:hypothetical protein
MKKKMPLPNVKDCIARIEETDYRFTGQCGTAYYFESDKRPLCFKEMRFTLTELRHAFKYGW